MATKTTTTKTESTPEGAPQQSKIASVLIGLLIIASGLLVYNYFQTATSPETTVVETDEKKDKADSSTISPQDKDEEEGGSYTVVAGDTLWSVAEKVYGDGHRWVDIDEANEIERNSLGQPMIEVGQRLATPGSAAVAEKPDAEGSTETDGDEDDNKDKEVADKGEDRDEADEKDGDQKPSTESTYTVVAGDTLWSIAEQHYGNGAAWTLIFEDDRNNLGMLDDHTPLIHRGNVLHIPAALPAN